MWDSPWACISVSSPKLSHPIISKSNLLALLQLEFYDADLDRPEYEAEHLFNRYHAEQILDFVEELQGKIDLLMVHCEAGMSRSPAVGAAIAKLGWDDDRVFFKQYTPNMKVYRTLMEIGMERKDQSEKNE